MFLPHFDVLCDLLLNRRTATWNLFVLYNKETTTAFLFQNLSQLLESRPGKHEKKPFDVICCLYKIKQSHWLLCITRNHDWSAIGPEKSRQWLKWLLVETKTWTANWTAKSTNLKENSGKNQVSFCHPCAPKTLNVALNIAGVERILFGKHAIAVNTERNLIRVWNERRVSDDGNLCPLWLMILKLFWHSIGDTLWLQYSWPRTVVSYTFLAVMPWNGLEHSRRKVRLCVYFNWI